MTLREEISVLYVDDETELSSMVATYLEGEFEDAQLTVETVTDPHDALDRLADAEMTVDCVVSDYEMPDMDGLEFLRALRRIRPNLPFILYTGRGSEDVVRDAFRVGATDYVQKATGTDQYAVLTKRVANAVSRNRAEETTERYDSAFEALETAVYVLDRSGRFVSVDDVFVELLGYERDAVVGTHVSTVSADDEDCIREKLDHLFDGTESDTTRFETEVYAADGERIHCVATVSPRVFDGSVHRAVGTLHDVTEQRRRREVEKSREWLKDLILDTSTTLMSAEVDEIGTKIHWTLQSLGEFADVDAAVIYSYDADTDALQKSHEWTADGASPRPTAVRSNDCEWLLDRLCRFENVRAPDAGAVPSCPVDSLSLPDDGSLLALPMVSNWSLVGALMFVSTESRRWPDKDVSLFGTAADMLSYTLERKQRERQLHQQNERLEEFASVVSHDLRNPMNVVDGFVDLARETGDVSHLDRAVNGLERMDALVNDVLELARQGRTVGETSTVDLSGVVERAWGAVDTGGATLELVGELGTVSADPGRLTQVFENLVRNAVEHGPTGSRSSSDDAVEHGSTDGDDSRGVDADAVTVTVGPLPNRGGFYVEDDGPGIPPEDRAAVFEQGHTTTEGGSGFGLSIVEGIVEAHGWSVAVTEGRGGGARFEITTASHAQAFDPPRAD
ncbi:pas domain s-box [Halogeometricum pallidum JCM 14848]|uniref:histidine kinase n=1 Tax=Halogeometricum pallidum JCM 14848 TaxID=1227487 RepID=M0DFZ5_HALPD|nr:response regulator [Halogeometricum pallidum]ELZ34421.1 pas domain s-box [Halogeometricum pallidum JCM 14848]